MGDDTITITTFGDLIAYRHKLSGYCRRCEKGREFDPSTRPAGEEFVGRRFTCRDCGSVMELTLSPPAWEPRD